MIKSPLRYPGGKSRAVKFIAPLIPEFDEYREPFIGGGSVFIYLKQLYTALMAWAEQWGPFGKEPTVKFKTMSNKWYIYITK